ncbi:uncharacterized protein Nmag_2963 [Natrialba magadii ATCC 43099]|uniref:Halobacterial output domain-containing protein n=1 Tax=Natrialba magadii (strain ATCC 43099 / DSM 3394 / CCM 3739 / CIP 104546 / IAM 13178 / JCM 8861 / NBRC 102185 / NCIMB 2190 / MS3) TaxID=547559 RepID=D3T0N6_NATMM|nr:HalOD1 output domain-containing protein [Natrialba magadii]ADD06515.1 uncharacterized protein Nmag_2963 [Natrialba magadii ATCC 43099]ELY32023.1 hypothetical protein C500_05578 [Natrialba magadii ATCC 43099]
MTEYRPRKSHGCEFSRRVRYTRTASEPPSIAVATALAQYRDEDVTAASTRLYDYVDPEALDALFENTNMGRERTVEEVTFHVGDAAVTVLPDEVVVAPN